MNVNNREGECERVVEEIYHFVHTTHIVYNDYVELLDVGRPLEVPLILNLDCELRKIRR